MHIEIRELYTLRCWPDPPWAHVFCMEYLCRFKEFYIEDLCWRIYNEHTTWKRLAKLSIKKPIRSHKETQNMTDKVLLIRVQPFPVRNILINLLGGPKTGYSFIFPRSSDSWSEICKISMGSLPKVDICNNNHYQSYFDEIVRFTSAWMKIQKTCMRPQEWRINIHTKHPLGP